KISDFVTKIKKNTHKSVGIFNTICYNTTVRQEEVRALAQSTDAVLVLGAKHSANTRRLAEVAREYNSNVIFANSVGEVKSSLKAFKDIQSVSIVAGASTPPWLIREVNKLMSETTQITAENSAEVEVNKEATLQEQTAPAQGKEPETMADLMKTTNVGGNYTNYQVGRRIKGTVISVGESGIYVAFGGKKDGFIDKTETSIDGNYNPSDFQVGDTVYAKIKSVEKEYVKLSKKDVDVDRAAEEEAEKALAAGEFSLVMTEVVKDGLRGRMGQYTVFVPASQIRIGYVNNLEDYKGKKLRLMIMPPKAKANAEAQEGEETAEVAEVKAEETAKPQHRKKYLVASQRMILEKEKKEKEDAFWGKMHVNDIVTGKVKRFTPFGAFVSVDGFDCLAHISELSWNRITDPSTVLKIGDVKDFVVLKLDREAGRISLGYKQLQKKPYEIAAEKYPVGTVVKGKVERIFPYGAFVSIEDGIDGLVHVSQISHNWIKDASEALTAGQEVEAKIIGFEDTRITLSIKDLLPTPDESITAIEVDGEATEEEKASKRSSRMKKFEQKVADGEGRKRAPKKEASNEPKEWVSGSGSASLGELFKGLNLDLAEDAEQSEEAPKKKTTRKKKTETTDAE
ncbi:MAG: S1 RNA-binding domain-containing protein, partial [Bacteroides sp.]|nr:S1 RNA-binding domain-containing protein [Bacteroides sp.]